MKMVGKDVVKERALWTGTKEVDKGTLFKVLAPKKWSDVEVKKFFKEVEVWFDAIDIKGARKVKTLSTLLESIALK